MHHLVLFADFNLNYDTVLDVVCVVFIAFEIKHLKNNSPKLFCPFCHPNGVEEFLGNRNLYRFEHRLVIVNDMPQREILTDDDGW